MKEIQGCVFRYTLMGTGDVAFYERTNFGLKNAFLVVEVKIAHDFIAFSTIRHFDEQQSIRQSTQELKSKSSIHD
jgi:S-methylmethionine-dependent homocysteine/selenocysteine methylase